MMKPLSKLTALLLTVLLAACSGVEVKVADVSEFSSGNYQTFSWRSEPFTNSAYSRDPVYVIDPILREITDAQLQSKGFRRVARGGDFTVDYIYAPGFRMGADSSQTDNLSPRAGVRPNTRISQAERDNAIALSGVRETRNVRLGFNDGKTGLEVWNLIITKIASDVNEPDPGRIRSALNSGIKSGFKDLPAATL